MTICEVCEFSFGQHDGPTHALADAIAKLGALHDALAERVEKLEVGRAELHDRCDGLSDAIGSLEQAAEVIDRQGEQIVKLTAKVFHGTCIMCGGDTPASSVNVCGREHMATTTKVGPPTSGQLASAGEATVPPGWKLAPGWRLSSYGADGTGCSGGKDEHWGESRAAYVRGGMFDRTGACAAHALEMGALVEDEPPAEQPFENIGGFGRAEQPARDITTFVPDGRPHRENQNGSCYCDACCVRAGLAPAEQPTCVDIAFTCENCGPGAEPDDLGDCVKCKGDLTGVPAEQPSRQETPGGETGEAIDWSVFVPSDEIRGERIEDIERGAVFASISWMAPGESGVVGSVRRNRGGASETDCLAGSTRWNQGVCRIIRHADGRWADGYNPSGPCEKGCGTKGPVAPVNWWHTVGGSFCTQFCRDRAKAKAAERRIETLAKERDEALVSMLAAEPSGAGQVPSAPGQPTSIISPPTKFQPLPCLKCGKPRLECWCFAAEPPAPAVGTLSLAEQLRQYNTEEERRELIDEVAALEARLAQAELFLRVKDKVVAGFEKRATESDAKLAQAERDKASATQSLVDEYDRRKKAERERDEWHYKSDELNDKLAQAEKRAEANEKARWEFECSMSRAWDKARQAERERDAAAEEGRKRHLAAVLRAEEAERERDEFDLRNGELKAEAIDEATAKERERCWRAVDAHVSSIWVRRKIDEVINGTPTSPTPKCDPDPAREVAPDRTQRGGGR